MLQLLKMFWFVIRELAFDSKEEYNFKSNKFNSKKVTLAIMLMLSLFLNIWTLVRFYDVSTNYIEAKKEHTENKDIAEKLTKDNSVLVIKNDSLRADLVDLEYSLRICKQKQRYSDKKPSQDLIK